LITSMRDKGLREDPIRLLIAWVAIVLKIRMEVSKTHFLCKLADLHNVFSTDLHTLKS
jgi:hypothetical protein